MAKSESVLIRVEPQIKKESETILKQLGLSMSSAVGLFLQQIIMQKRIPFDVAISYKRPLSYQELTDEEFDELIERGLKDYQEGNVYTTEEVFKELDSI